MACGFFNICVIVFGLTTSSAGEQAVKVPQAMIALTLTPAPQQQAAVKPSAPKVVAMKGPIRVSENTLKTKSVR